MQITAFDDALEFQRQTKPILANHEPKYNFIMGLLASLATEGWQGRYSAPPQLVLIEEQNQPIGLAIRTPPHGLLLTDLPPAAMVPLATWLHDANVDLPSTLAPKATADIFAAKWSHLSGKHAKLRHAMRTHAISRVLLPPLPPGQMRQATNDDFDLLISWATQFSHDVNHPPRDEAPIVRRSIESGGLWLWANGKPFAMANCGQPTPSGIRINWVYTPPEHRRHGYATALVALLSQHLLHTGRQFCFLFTDLANPTSNSIYRKIGYEGVCDYAEYDFAQQDN